MQSNKISLGVRLLILAWQANVVGWRWRRFSYSFEIGWSADFRLVIFYALLALSSFGRPYALQALRRAMARARRLASSAGYKFMFYAFSHTTQLNIPIGNCCCLPGIGGAAFYGQLFVCLVYIHSCYHFCEKGMRTTANMQKGIKNANNVDFRFTCVSQLQT